ncbi:MAG: NDP-sugar synthase [Thermoleophilia bacterium]
MIAVVLVGGEGTRLRPLTLDEPKPVLPIGGIPFLSLLLDRLAAAGVTRVVFSCGYLPERLRAGIGTPPPGVQVEVVVEDEPLGTAGAIRFAAAGRVDGPFLALNGDVLGDADFSALVRAHADAGATAAIGLTPVDDPTRFGVVVCDESGNVERFVEKPPNADGLGPAPWWVNAGAYVLDPSVLDLIPADQMVSIEREVFPLLVGKGLIACQAEGYWRDIGTLESYLAANADAIGGQLHTRIGGSPTALLVDPTASVATDAQLIAPVLIGAGAEVAAGATIGPDAVIGAGSRIGPGSIVRSAVVLDAVEIGAEVTIERSVVGRGATVGERSSLLDSALGTGQIVGADQTLTDERRPS